MRNVVVRKAGKKGKGVFAARDFRKGEIVLPYKKGRILRGNVIPKVWKGKFRHLDRVGEDEFIIMKPPERYINCSCDPNVFIKNWKIIAMKPIKKGEEIAYDCAINNSYDVKQKCFCGAKICRGRYPLSFFKLDKRLQKKYLPYLDTWSKKLYKKKLEEIKKAVKEDVEWGLHGKAAKS